MINVRVKKEEAIENALRRFKRKCKAEGVINEVRRNSHFVKPSEKRRAKRHEAHARFRRNR